MLCCCRCGGGGDGDGAIVVVTTAAGDDDAVTRATTLWGQATLRGETTLRGEATGERSSVALLGDDQIFMTRRVMKRRKGRELSDENNNVKIKYFSIFFNDIRSFGAKNNSY